VVAISYQLIPFFCFLDSVEKEDLPITQMFQGTTCDVTYLPVYHKSMNHYVDQAGHVMKFMDPLLDSFLWFIKSVIQVEFGRKREMVQPGHGGNTRHCNIAILTMGSVESEVNGFANELHMDEKDVLKGDFSKIALRELSQFEATYCSDPFVLRDVKYLRSLYELCDGFPVATVCGYQMPLMNGLKKRGDNSSCFENLHAHFPMPGIGSSVRLRPGMYHYFLGGVFSHCTSVPVTVHNRGVKCNKYSLFSRNGRNVVAWGAGSSSGNTVWGNFLGQNYADEDDDELRPINNRGLLNWLRNPRNGNRLVGRESRGNSERRIIDAAVAARVRGAVGVRNELDNNNEN
jgi:hypothetical protein